MAGTFGGYEILDPAAEREAAAALGHPTAPWAGMANYFHCPVGPGPGRGMLLMLWRDLSRLDREASHSLILSGPGTSVTLKSLVVGRAGVAVCGARDDPNTSFWVEIFDRRALAMAGPPLNTSYNVPNAAGTAYLSASKNGGSAWTWATMLSAIWTANGKLDAYPGLPFTPEGTPEGFAFWGVSSYDALNQVLDRVGCALKLDPLTDTFSIVRVASADTAAADALERADPIRIWDAYPVEPSRTRVPETVRVFFPEVRAVALTTGAAPYYTLDRTDSTPDAGVEAGTVVALLDDLSAVYDSAPSLTNAAALGTRADERATDYFRRVKEDRLARRYSGAMRGVGPGSKIKGTLWADRGGGVVTEVIRAPGASPSRPWLEGERGPAEASAFPEAAGPGTGGPCCQPSASAIWPALLPLLRPWAASLGVSDGDKGDITVSGSGTVWTIDAGAVDLTTKVTGVLPGANGGTGVVNTGKTITLGGNLATSGANAVTFTTAGATNVTLPTTGTLVNSAVASLPSLSSVGTITAGVWQGTVIGLTYGGHGQATAYAGLDALTVQSGDMASAATVTLASSTGASVHITGTTTITSFGAAAAGLLRFITFGGAMQLTHNATSMILIGGADVTTAAADTAIFASEGSGNWRCLAYFRNTYLPGNAQTSGTLAQFAATTSLQLKGVISDETGSGALVFGTGPSISSAVITASTVRLISSLSVEDTAADHEMFIASGEDLSANRTLTFVLNDANRTVTVTAAASIGGTNTGDQTITLTGNVTGTGTGSFATTIAAGVVTEAMQTLADNTTGDVSITKHGYAPKAPNDTAKYLRGDGTWATVSGTLDITGLTGADLASGDEFPFYDASAAANRKATLIKVGGYSRLQPGGRLTGVTATPAGEGTSLSTLYYAPYAHDLLPLWDGTRWLLYQFTEFSLALSGLTTGKPYDVFCYDSAGTPTLELLVWTNDTTRATGLTLTHGRYNKTGDQTRLYLGTLYTTGTTTFSDTPQHRLLWNAFNRVQYDDATWDTTDSWTDAGNGTWSAINGGNTNWIHTLVRGLDIEPTAADLQITAQTEYQFALALDSSSAISRTATTFGGQNSGATMNTTAMARFQTGIGRHTVNGLETTASSTTRTAYGDNGAGIGSGTLGVNSGMRVRGWR